LRFVCTAAVGFRLFRAQKTSARGTWVCRTDLAAEVGSGGVLLHLVGLLHATVSSRQSRVTTRTVSAAAAAEAADCAAAGDCVLKLYTSAKNVIFLPLLPI